MFRQEVSSFLLVQEKLDAASKAPINYIRSEINVNETAGVYLSGSFSFLVSYDFLLNRK